jgi:ADP-heptose:LPS heptosyltransferase
MMSVCSSLSQNLMQSPLVIFHKQLGDLLLLEPGLARLSCVFGGPVRLSTRAAYLPMVSLMANVIGESGVRFSRASRVISLSGNFHAAAKTFATSSPDKQLFVLDQKDFKRWHPVIYPQGIGCVPAWVQYRARYYFDIMPDASKMEFRTPKLRKPPADWSHPRVPESYILLHPTSAWPSKSWSAKSWSTVLNELNAAGYGPFVLTGGPKRWEKDYANEVCKTSEAEILNLAGETTLHQYLHTVAHARLLLCIDGSSSHLAPAFERPSITLFGNTPHSVWHLGSEMSSLLAPPPHEASNEHSIDRITVNSVIQLALQKLSSQ